MAVDAKTVKELRERTGLPMMKCKKALTETDGDMDQAIELLRKESKKAGEKRADRENNEGIISTASDDKFNVVVELKCETDFVARNQDFKDFSADLCQQVLKNGDANILDQKYIKNEAITISQAIEELTLKIGEKISIGNIYKKDGVVGVYVHHDCKQAAIIQLKGNRALNEDEKVQEALTGICQHIVFTSPASMTPEDISPEIIEKERETYKEEVKNKPADIQEKIIDGKIKKFYSEACLLEQKFIKDDKITIKQIIGNLGKEVNAEIAAESYNHITIG